jgi:hypothetical protein
VPDWFLIARVIIRQAPSVKLRRDAKFTEPVVPLALLGRASIKGVCRGVI